MARTAPMGTNRKTWLALTLTVAGLLAGCSSGAGPTEEDTDGDGVADAADCAPGDASRWRLLEGSADDDRDGVGAGAMREVCAGERLPEGWSQQSGDCAPGDATRWRERAGLYPDHDGDGATAEGPVTGCVGEPLVGYREQPGAPDCDDNAPASPHPSSSGQTQTSTASATASPSPTARAGTCPGATRRSTATARPTTARARRGATTPTGTRTATASPCPRKAGSAPA